MIALRSTLRPRSLGDNTNTAFANPLPAGQYNYPVDQMTIGRQHFQIETNNTLLTNQTDIGGKFYTGSLLHTFSAGFEATRETRYQQRARGVGPSGSATNLCEPTQPACRTSAYYPVDTSFGGFFGGWNTSLSTEATTIAAYAFDRSRSTNTSRCSAQSGKTTTWLSSVTRVTQRPPIATCPVLTI